MNSGAWAPIAIAACGGVTMISSFVSMSQNGKVSTAIPTDSTAAVTAFKMQKTANTVNAVAGALTCVLGIYTAKEQTTKAALAANSSTSSAALNTDY